MKLRFYAGIVFGSAVLVSHTPALAQIAPEITPPDTVEAAPLKEAPTMVMPSPEQPEITPTPIAPAAAPELTPMPETAPPERREPDSGSAAPLPTLETTTPGSPTATPMAAPTGPVPAAMTTVLPQETITGIKTVSLPEPMPIRPAYFTLPIILKVAQDTSVTSSTPISDRYTEKATWDINAWAAGVRNCLQQQPKLMRIVGDQSAPFMLGGTEGTIVLNANNKSVCPM